MYLNDYISAIDGKQRPVYCGKQGDGVILIPCRHTWLRMKRNSENDKMYG